MARRMLEYIKEQPEVWRKITDDRESLFQGAVEKLQQPVKRIVILGSGSSYIASMAAADFYGKMLGLEAAAVVPTRLDGLLRLLNPDETLLIAVSQSGRSTSTIDAVKKWKECGFCILAVTADEQSPVAKESDVHHRLRGGDGGTEDERNDGHGFNPLSPGPGSGQCLESGRPGGF